MLALTQRKHPYGHSVSGWDIASEWPKNLEYFTSKNLRSIQVEWNYIPYLHSSTTPKLISLGAFEIFRVFQPFGRFFRISWVFLILLTIMESLDISRLFSNSKFSKKMNPFLKFLNFLTFWGIIFFIISRVFCLQTICAIYSIHFIAISYIWTRPFTVRTLINNSIFIENCVHNFYAERMCGFAGKAILHMKTWLKWEE